MKKALAIVLAMALLCIISIGGTLTYFTSTDYDKNTMTVGKVEIEQNETFNQNSPLRPYIGEATLENGLYDVDKNAVTKEVTVKNVGSETAYIRTLFAFEVVNGKDPLDSTNTIIHANVNTGAGSWTKVSVNPIVVTKDGVTVTYVVYAFTYNATYGENTITPASLKQIALDCRQDNAFYDYVGSEYNILVLSQAVQTAGFATAEAAFAAAFSITDENLTSWFTNATERT